MREIRSYGTVGGLGGNAQVYPEQPGGVCLGMVNGAWLMENRDCGPGNSQFNLGGRRKVDTRPGFAQELPRLSPKGYAGARAGQAPARPSCTHRI